MLCLRVCLAICASNREGATAQEAVKSLLNTEQVQSSLNQTCSLLFPIAQAVSCTGFCWACISTARHCSHTSSSLGHRIRLPNSHKTPVSCFRSSHLYDDRAKTKQPIFPPENLNLRLRRPQIEAPRRSAWPHSSRVYPERQAAAAPTKAVTSMTRCFT